MDRGIARDARPDYLYNGGVLWLLTGPPAVAPGGQVHSPGPYLDAIQ